MTSCLERGAALRAQSIEKAFGLFDAKGRDCVRLKFFGISGRRTDLG